MATLDYNVGTPLGPDPRAVEDLRAIDEYVRTVARSRLAKYPKSLPLVEDYERWRQQVGWWELNVMVNDTMRAAKAKRDAINAAQGSTFPSTTQVEEGAFVTAPPETAGIGLGWKGFLFLGGVAAGGYAAWRVFGRR